VSDCFVAVDAGTTRLKSIAVDTAGTELARASRPSPLSHPRPGWVAQDMTATWELTAATVREVVDALDAHDVVAVGVTGQGAGCWLLDDDGEPVRDAVLWSDGRAADLVREWRDTDVYDETFDDMGYGLFSGLPLAIYRWLAAHEPETLDAAETAFFCKDWIRYRLTGVRATDPTDASLAHYRPAAGRFSPEVADRLGVPSVVDAIPEPASPTAVTGYVTERAAETTGLPTGLPVVTGVMDVAASAFGSGVVRPGEASSIVGTTLQSQVLLDDPQFAPPRTGYTLALGVDGMGLRAMGAMTGTPNIDWAVETLADGADFERVERAARSVPVGAGGVMYHPYLSGAGEKAPFVHPGARAQFTGLTPDHTRGHLLRAVYEGVALAMRDCYECLPGTVETVRLSGGGAGSAFWCGLFADCLDARVVVPAGEELGARGAALLAGIATGHYDGLADAADRTATVDRSYDPDPAAVDRYDRWYDHYRDTREALTDLWTRRERLRAAWSSSEPHASSGSR
jgi:sugar (pentulose or hexulose) kinase